MIKMRIAVVIVVFALLGAARVHASAEAPAQVKASKGPVEISLRLEKTKVKSKRYLWYKLELKNIGKKKLRVDDWVFRDPWGMYENCDTRYGIYLEVIDPEGNPMTVRAGGDRVHYNWEPKGDETLPYSPEERAEIAALRAEWRKRGLTERQQTLALNDWNNKKNAEKNRAEDSDPARQLWLEPGASTATVAWVDRGPGAYAGRSEDDESLRKGYTELWSYKFLDAGKYRIRAVYDHSQSESTKALFEKHEQASGDSWVKFKTPFIEFQVVP